MRLNNIGDVPLNNNGNNSYIKDVLHVPTITKNVVFVGQIVEQGMTVQFSLDGCFIKDKGRLVTHRSRGESKVIGADKTRAVQQSQHYLERRRDVAKSTLSDEEQREDARAEECVNSVWLRLKRLDKFDRLWTR